ncbi:unnamed protein product [Lupinus luteus]|uniref:Uncharacterized protein n=1 Tax=Lupinus luteus TaxID=3873 RepID=A0AAV1WPH8_LUPLU
MSDCNNNLIPHLSHHTIGLDGVVATSSGGHRPRGRPAGSENEPKPSIIVARDSPNALRSHVLEVSSGAEIVETLSNYARICLLVDLHRSF